MKSVITTLLCCSTAVMTAQTIDTLYGKVKALRERVLFLDANKQGLKLFENDSDYGHQGFTSPDIETHKFRSFWYETTDVHYVNYYKEFNTDGKAVYEIWFYKNKDTVKEYRYKYNKHHLLQLVEIGKLDTFYNNYAYNDKNNISSSLKYSLKIPNWYRYTEYIYDYKQRLVQKQRFDEERRMFGYKYIYDSKGRLTSIVKHIPYKDLKIDKEITFSIRDDIGEERLLNKFFYDNQNREIGSEYYELDYTDDGSIALQLQQKVKKHYHKESNLVVKFVNIIGDIEKHETYQYDKKGRIRIKQCKDLSNSENNKSEEYKYNTQGDIIQLIYIKGKRKSDVVIEYVYDVKGNWIQQTKIVNDKRLYVWLRDITYYK